MQRFTHWLVFLLLLLVFILSVGFSMWNTAPVALSFGIHEFAARPLSFWLIVTFCLGGLTGLVIGGGLFRGARLRLRIRRLEKELARRSEFKPSEID
ncbi:lipopolysaccharide assembly protein LapA domain-containing protein [Pseudohongiella sp.]|uniref:Lipopolysaccharide assembly protein A domain-containing protein n=1 Tax=marine sediment metagenome TaxID=412755 RepID=A0A0F9Z0N5_9ZZZZ|nr:lipopolysaccharide assembly protein LapA domain-containing protein [Pseudohongiella sp.]HDZ09892.1 LapA family protein [Pseudohongiella sp.]HEA63638.1 LapA family protein [Pseudohongiella sp.]